MLASALLLAFACQSAPADADANASAKAPFTGQITFTRSADGGPDAEFVRDLAAGTITVSISPDSFRLDLDKGLAAGSVIVHNGSNVALRLDHETRSSSLGNGAPLDELDPEVKDFMVWHFKTDLEATDERETICGHPTRKYLVKKSAFVREGAEAAIWVAEQFDVPRRRYSFNFEFVTPTVPLPMSIPVSKGTILKSVVVENGVRVITVASKIKPGAPPADLFQKTPGYTGPDFPAAAQPSASKKQPAISWDLDSLPRSVENELGMLLVRVDPVTFQMGSPESEAGRKPNETQHEVTLTQPFYIAITEVTQEQWASVMGEDNPSSNQGPQLPVDSVSWTQASEFCERLSEREGRHYRLPTEAEWECAARAGERVDFSAMSTAEHKDWLSIRAWQYDNAEYSSHLVGQLKANAWGLFDMLGNVAEWTADGFGDYPAGAITDPAGMQNNEKVLRGHDWISSHAFCRPASRDKAAPDKTKSTIGLRVVCDPQ